MELWNTLLERMKSCNALIMSDIWICLGNHKNLKNYETRRWGELRPTMFYLSDIAFSFGKHKKLRNYENPVNERIRPDNDLFRSDIAFSFVNQRNLMNYETFLWGELGPTMFYLGLVLRFQMVTTRICGIMNPDVGTNEIRQCFNYVRYLDLLG